MTMKNLEQGAFVSLANGAAKGNQDAVNFLKEIYFIAHTWDDLVDGDVTVTQATLSRMMRKALVDLPRNPFYRAHFDRLSVVLENAILLWDVATGIERTRGGQILEAAYIMRSAYVDLISHVALICGGFAHAVGITHEARSLAHAEGFAEYLQNLDTEKRQRG